MTKNTIISLGALLLNTINILYLLVSHSDFKKDIKEFDPIIDMMVTNQKIRIAGFIVIEIIIIYFLVKELIQ